MATKQKPKKKYGYQIPLTFGFTTLQQKADFVSAVEKNHISMNGAINVLIDEYIIKNKTI